MPMQLFTNKSKIATFEMTYLMKTIAQAFSEQKKKMEAMLRTLEFKLATLTSDQRQMINDFAAFLRAQVKQPPRQQDKDLSPQTELSMEESTGYDLTNMREYKLVNKYVNEGDLTLTPNTSAILLRNRAEVWGLTPGLC